MAQYVAMGINEQAALIIATEEAKAKLLTDKELILSIQGLPMEQSPLSSIPQTPDGSDSETGC